MDKLKYLSIPHQSWKPLEKATPENRQVHAVEFIALCMSRIDLHLERIADAIENHNKR